LDPPQIGVVSAASILEAMDITVDPCTDFFTFSCGGWIEKAAVHINTIQT
jgi:predicted metalloendopeptidase